MGTYNPAPRAGFIGNCLACDAGSACPFSGLLAPNASCAAGHYCPAGTVTPTESACPPGSYTDSRALMRVEECAVCPAAKACGWGTGGADNAPSDCSKGFYCPAATEFPAQHACPPGTYGTQRNYVNASQCVDCEAGVYCTGGQQTNSGRCAAGHYCPARSRAPTDNKCPARPARSVFFSSSFSRLGLCAAHS